MITIQPIGPWDVFLEAEFALNKASERFDYPAVIMLDEYTSELWWSMADEIPEARDWIE